MRCRAKRVASANVLTIVYTSRATKPMSALDLTSLLQVAHDRNQAANVTDMLLYAHESFMQALEGETDAVEGIYRSICADPRHTEIDLLSRREVGIRTFPRWSMGFEQPEDESLSDLGDGSWPLRESALVNPRVRHDGDTAEALLRAYAARLPA